MKTNFSVFLTGFFVATFFFIQSGILEAQPKSKEYYGMDYSKSMVFIPGNELVAPFFISDNPVTNKEYILYLIWTSQTYNVYYPEVLFDALPGFNSSVKPDGNFSPFSDSASFNYYLNHSESYVSEYIFNPNYLNSAVIGISWEQANKYSHWLSDRYNEFSLINMKYLVFSLDQLAENNFQTESFILRQYEGVVRNQITFFMKKPENGFNSVDNLLRPSFHMATRYELQTATKQFKLVDCFCASTRDPEFLKPWNDFYLPEKKGYIYFNSPDNYVPLGLSSGNTKSEIKLPDKISEWCFDSYIENEEKSIPDIYRSFGYDLVKFLDPSDEANRDFYPQKDRFGTVPFIITGENKEREFEMIKAPVNMKSAKKANPSYIFDHKTNTVLKRDGDIYTCFRVAVNAILKR
jgi:hypothetical protein